VIELQVEQRLTDLCCERVALAPELCDLSLDAAVGCVLTRAWTNQANSLIVQASELGVGE
jgi:hypothetical protein